MSIGDRLRGTDRARRLLVLIAVPTLLGALAVVLVGVAAGDAVPGPLVFLLVGTVGVVALRYRWIGRWTSAADRVVGDQPTLGVFGGPPAIEIDVEGRTVTVAQVSTLEQAPAGGPASVDEGDRTTTLFSTPAEGGLDREFEVVGHRQPGRDREFRDDDLSGEPYAVRAADDAVAEAVITPAVERELDTLASVGVLTVSGYADEVTHAVEGAIYDPERIERNARVVARLARSAESAGVPSE